MATVTVEKNSIERREKRAQSIAAMGLVNRVGDRFNVLTPSLRGKQTSYEVWRDNRGKICCNCLEFEENVNGEETFRCEHILAVKHSLLTKNSEAVTKQAIEEKPKNDVVLKDKNATESREKSTRGEQKTDKVKANVSTAGHVETKKAETESLANTGDKKMKQENLKEMPFTAAAENAETETPSNVMNFPKTLRQLRQNVDPNLVKTREGWRDRNGNVHLVDYVEWHTVADILDETAPNWTHAIRDIREIGSVITVIVAITIDGITREGIGTGLADSEMGIKKAEHDALKRAAVKFGIARDLYKKESDTIEREGAVPPPQNDGGFPANPVAKTIGDLVTAKQLGMIRALAREKGIEPEEECQSVMQCRTDELSKKAASSFIQHLQDFQTQQDAVQMPLRRVS